MQARDLIAEAELRIHTHCLRVDIFDAEFDAESYFAIAMPLTAFVKALLDSKISVARKTEIRKRFVKFRDLIDRDVPDGQAVKVTYTPKHRDAILFIMKEWESAKRYIPKQPVVDNIHAIFGNFEEKLDKKLNNPN